MSSSKRLLVIAGAVAIGSTGAFAFAPAASAESRIALRDDQASVCLENGAGVQITWNIQNNTGEDVTLADVSRPGIKGITNGATVKAGNGLKGEENLGVAEYGKTVELTFTAVATSGDKATVVGKKKVPSCKGAPTGDGAKAPGNAANPPKFEPIVATADCDGMKITITNPDKTKDVPVKVTVGTVTRKDETLAPGKSTVVQLGRDNHTVNSHVTIGDVSKDLSYSVPSTCGKALAMTGTNTALIGGAAVLLVGAGAGLFLVARRRRVRFTA